jgi:hypothetical protein
MQWQALNNSKGLVVDIHKEQSVADSVALVPTHHTPILKTGV